jgi:hypothetical protein
MSITPPGGWVNPPQRLEENHFTIASDLCCPNCHYSDWKAASLVYREGLSVTNSRTKGTGIGIGRAGLRNGNFAVGGATYKSRTSGVKQTLLSQAATPPQMRLGLIIFLAILCVFFALGAFGGLTQGRMMQTVFDGVIAVILMFAIHAVYERQRRKYNASMSTYENTRMCQRCGTFYLERLIPESHTALHLNLGNRRAMMLGLAVLLFAGAVFVFFPLSESGISPASGSSQQAHSDRDPSALKRSQDDPYGGQTLMTSKGLLEVTVPPNSDPMDALYAVKLAGREITVKQGAGIQFAFSYPETNPSLIVLQLLTGGNGCIASYQVLDLTTSKTLLSRETDDCYGDTPKINVSDGVLYMDFSGESTPSPEHWKYTPANVRLGVQPINN